MEEGKSIDQALNEVLVKAREDFQALASINLVGTTESERKTYFAQYSLLKELISTIESFLDGSRRIEGLLTVPV